MQLHPHTSNFWMDLLPCHPSLGSCSCFMPHLRVSLPRFSLAPGVRLVGPLSVGCLVTSGCICSEGDAKCMFFVRSKFQVVTERGASGACHTLVSGFGYLLTM